MTPGPQYAFRALADPTRRGILAILREGDKTIGEVAECFAMTRPAVKKHLRMLEDGDLITVIPRGRERVNRLHRPGLQTCRRLVVDIGRGLGRSPCCTGICHRI